MPVDAPPVEAAGDAAAIAASVAGSDVSSLLALVDRMARPAGDPINIALYRTWLDGPGAQSASAFAIWFNLGVQYVAPSAIADRIVCYKNALLLKPDFYQAAINLGLAYEAMGDVDRALATWRGALQADDARTALLNHVGRANENLKRLDHANAALTASLLTTPAQPDVLHHIVGLRTKMCLWPLYGAGLPGVAEADLVAATRALTAMAVFDDNAHLAAANASWIAEKMPAAPERLAPVQPYGHDRLRIGYLSSDYCAHPVAYLVAELFERHDRTRVDVYGYCATKDDGSAVRARVLSAFDHRREVRGVDDEALARLIRADEIDVLVDLNGLTLGTRLAALRWRPAPLQLTYLGYNGPVPLPELDGIVADTFVIPPQSAATHQPAPLYMPGCFQVNDALLPVAAAGSRAAAGLPDDRFVFCSFSNTYKITEAMFDCWMEILHRTGDAVLWLLVDNPYAKDNLLARAGAAGIAAERLIFAGRVEPSLYRGRLALADLFLDTYPYNSGVTASDALRVGLPLLTLCGETFTARQAGSLLHAMGLDDLIATTRTDYVERAVRLATEPAHLADVRTHVTPARWAATLGNTARFCRAFEDALFARVGRPLSAAA